MAISHQHNGSWRVGSYTHYLQAHTYGGQEYHLDITERRRKNKALRIVSRIAGKHPCKISDFSSSRF